MRWIMTFTKPLVVTVFFLALGCWNISLAQETINGTVSDAQTGETLPGVNILVKGTTTGTSADAEGQFELTVPSLQDTLVASYIGYQTKDVAIGGQTELDIQLTPEAIMGEEMVVVGYGTQKEVNLTGSVSQITSEAIENKPVANVGQALQGTIPNLNIDFANGSPNTEPSFNIRGATSFSTDGFTSGGPLILVDGVERDLNKLNPEDIKSVSVLKDAASAAIYGARASNGVILVTTKAGSRTGTPQITLNSTMQWNRPSATPDLLDAYSIQDAAIKAYGLRDRSAPNDMIKKRERIQAYMNNSEEEPIYYESSGGQIIWVGNTNVYDKAVRSYSPMQKSTLSLKGGNENNTYYVSVGFQRQEGLYKINTDKYNRYNGLLNFDSKITDWLSIDYGLSYNTSIYTEPVSPAGKGGWWTAMSQEYGRNINMPIKTPADSPVGVMYTDNILSFMDYGSKNSEKDKELLLDIAPTINILDKWSIKGSFSYRSTGFERKQTIPELERIVNDWNNPTTVHTSPTSVQRWDTNSEKYTLNIYSDYSLDLGKHAIDLTGGFNQEWYKYEYVGGRGEELLSPNIPVISQTLGNEFSYDSESHWAIRGVFYRVKYNYDDRYLLESNGRYDGTSRFPEENRFQFFPSVSAGWRISNEQFAEFLKPTFNEFKIRASYGSLGNQDVANYLFYPSYGTISQVNHLFNGERPVGITPPGLVDPNLTWETTTTINVGVDMTMIDKLDISFDWYRRRTSDIIVPGDKLPAVLGAAVPDKNAGTMQSVGWEFEARWRDQIQDEFRYDIALNVSDYQSEIIKFDGNPNKLLSGLYEGQKMGEIWGYKTQGLFQDQAEIDAAADQSDIDSGQWYPGDVRYKDLNGDGEITNGANTLEDHGDLKKIGNSTPRYRFGLDFNVYWKSFDLNLFLQGVGKRDVWIGDSIFWGRIANSSAPGIWEVYNNSWTPDRPNAFYPAYKAKGANIRTQTRYLQDASYIRLKNVAIGYTLPNDIAAKLKMKKLRVSVSAHNIWEVTGIPEIFDPELLDLDYPMIRSAAVGLQVSF